MFKVLVSLGSSLIFIFSFQIQTFAATSAPSPTLESLIENMDPNHRLTTARKCDHATYRQSMTYLKELKEKEHLRTLVYSKEEKTKDKAPAFHAMDPKNPFSVRKHEKIFKRSHASAQDKLRDIFLCVAAHVENQEDAILFAEAYNKTHRQLRDTDRTSIEQEIDKHFLIAHIHMAHGLPGAQLKLTHLGHLHHQCERPYNPNPRFESVELLVPSASEEVFAQRPIHALLKMVVHPPAGQDAFKATKNNLDAIFDELMAQPQTGEKNLILAFNLLQNLMKYGKLNIHSPLRALLLKDSSNPYQDEQSIRSMQADLSMSAFKWMKLAQKFQSTHPNDASKLFVLSLQAKLFDAQRISLHEIDKFDSLTQKRFPYEQLHMLGNAFHTDEVQEVANQDFFRDIIASVGDNPTATIDLNRSFVSSNAPVGAKSFKDSLRGSDRYLQEQAQLTVVEAKARPSAETLIFHKAMMQRIFSFFHLFEDSRNKTEKNAEDMQAFMKYMDATRQVNFERDMEYDWLYKKYKALDSSMHEVLRKQGLERS